MKKVFLVFCEVLSWIFMVLGGLAALPLQGSSYNVWGGIGGLIFFVFGLLINIQTKKVRKKNSCKG